MDFDVHKSVLIVGIGNTDRGDDAAGIEVARHLCASMSLGITVVKQSGEGTDLINLWQPMHVQTLYVVDAMVAGLTPGTIQRFEAHNSPLPAQFAGDYSTHSFGLPQAIELARALNYLPPQVIVYGIEGKCFDTGAAISLAVEMASRKVVNLIMTDLALLPNSLRPTPSDLHKCV